MPTIGTKWVIRHIPSGGLLPEPVGRKDKGHSFMEPVISGPNAIRLFDTHEGARRALIQWLRGKHHPIMEMDTDDYGNTYRYCAGTEIAHVPSRIKEEMEIIPVSLEIK